MQLHKLLIAAALLAALAGGIWYSNQHKSDDTKKTTADAAPKVLSIPEDQIIGVRIERTGQPEVALDRGGDGWKLTAPAELAADSEQVAPVVSGAASLQSDSLAEEKPASLAPFGLDTPGMRVTVKTRDGKSRTVLFGSEVPGAGGTYVKLENDARVYAVPAFTRATFEKTAGDLRDKRLLTFQPEKVARLALTAKGQTLEFGKNAQGEWQILKPGAYRADTLQVDELLRRLKDAKMDPAADAAKAKAGFAAGTRVATAEVTDAKGPQTLEIRKSGDQYYARSSAVEGVYAAAKDLGEGLDKRLNDFRNKKLFDFGFSDPNKVTVGALSFAKAGEKWFLNGKEMDAPQVQGLIDKLRELTATGFAPKAGGEPALEVSVVSSDGKKVEKVDFRTQAGQGFAVREGEAEAYRIDPNAISDLQKAASGVSAAPPPKKK